MSEDRCEKTELLKNSCAHCTGAEETNPFEGLLIDRFFSFSKYVSRCALDPTHTIAVGDDIGLAVQDNERGTNFARVGWVCSACVEGIRKHGGLPR